MSAKHDKTKVRIHESERVTRGKTYRQFCVRWYGPDGNRKQKCFGSRLDAEMLRDSILEAPSEWVPFGTTMVSPEIAKRASAACKKVGMSEQEMIHQCLKLALEDPKGELARKLGV